MIDNVVNNAPKEWGRKEVEKMGLLPKNERRTVDRIAKKTMWVYGAPYSGKTYLANTFPDVLMLNTDGNVKFVDAPYIAIKDTKDGRVDKQAWENFKAVIDELAMNNNDFKTIVVDLLEDTYQYCRQYVFKREGYVHESDGGFGKGWALVDDEFIPTIKKLLSLDYDNIILISHEDRDDVTMKTGEKITKIIPNLRSKIADKVAGMVDFTGRFVAEGDNRRIDIKQSEFQFGGGRTEFMGKKVPATYESICGLYNINPMEVHEAPKEQVTVAEKPTETVEEAPKRKLLKREDDGE